MTSQPRRWTLEDLLDSPGQLGRAQADARFYGNTSAREAINSLDRAVSSLVAELQDQRENDHDDAA